VPLHIPEVLSARDQADFRNVWAARFVEKKGERYTNTTDRVIADSTRSAGGVSQPVLAVSYSLRFDWRVNIGDCCPPGQIKTSA